MLTAIFTLLLYVVMEMRRKQRYIPVVTKPRNDSLDFVKTIGRLYYDKGDHKNLCRKMAAYFLEHVRNRYKLATGNLGDDFVKNLQFKTGYEESEIRGIVSYIKWLDESQAVSQNQLTDFHKQLESFYKKLNLTPCPSPRVEREDEAKMNNMEEQIFQQRTDLTALNEAVLSIRNEIKKIIVGQDDMVKLIIAALLADGHVLIEGVPGVSGQWGRGPVGRADDRVRRS